jgi:hypothetical protein
MRLYTITNVNLEKEIVTSFLEIDRSYTCAILGTHIFKSKHNYRGVTGVVL